MRWWVYAIIGGLTYVISLIASLPIQHVVNLLTSNGLPLVIGQISGSLWHGEAEQFNYKNIPLGPAVWHFVPLGLLQGRIEYAIALHNPDHTLDGQVAKEILSDGFSLFGLKGQIPADSLLQLSNLTNLSTTGQLELDLMELHVRHRQITSAAGEIRWLDAGIEQPVRADLGDLQFNLSADDQIFISDIKDLDGPIQVDGKLSLLPDGSYRLQGEVTPRDGSDPALINLIQSIGRYTKDGTVQVDYSGRM